MKQLVQSVPDSQKELWKKEIIQHYLTLSHRRGSPATEEDLLNAGTYSLRLIKHLFGGINGLKIAAGDKPVPQRTHQHKSRRHAS